MLHLISLQLHHFQHQEQLCHGRGSKDVLHQLHFQWHIMITTSPILFMQQDPHPQHLLLHQELLPQHLLIYQEPQPQLLLHAYEGIIITCMQVRVLPHHWIFSLSSFLDSDIDHFCELVCVVGYDQQLHLQYLRSFLQLQITHEVQFLDIQYFHRKKKHGISAVLCWLALQLTEQEPVSAECFSS